MRSLPSYGRLSKTNTPRTHRNKKKRRTTYKATMIAPMERIKERERKKLGNLKDRRD